MCHILHIVTKDDWKNQVLGGYYKPSSLVSDGFIHCSTIEQTVGTANQFYSNQNNLLLLCIEIDKLESELKFEDPACVGDKRTDMSFPHIYGPLNTTAVAKVVDFPLNKDGLFTLPLEISQFATK